MTVRLIRKEDDDDLIKAVTLISSAHASEAIKALGMNDIEQSIQPLLAKAIMEGLSEGEWSGVPGYDEMLKYGVYSPMQLLFYLASNNAQVNPDHDYPFLFGTVGHLLSTLTAENYIAVPDNADKYRRLLQTFFQMREIKEEGENLSIETYIPEAFGEKEGNSNNQLNLKKLSLIFGRGVGVVNSSKFPNRSDVKGGLYQIFRAHTGTPSSLLYNLEPINSHVPEANISLSLKRDKTVAVNAKNNPLLEFYDGGWHVVDFNSGRSVIDYCLNRYEWDYERVEIAKPLLTLAYHMATHWHSGILCVIDYDEANKRGIIEDVSEWSKSSSELMKETLKETSVEDLNLTTIAEKGYGRVILTNAIQDGATIFLPDGQFHSAGRVVRTFDKELADKNLGTGNRAARKLSQFGIALKVSKDGAIRLYSSKPEGNEALNGGLRIR